MYLDASDYPMGTYGVVRQRDATRRLLRAPAATGVCAEREA